MWTETYIIDIFLQLYKILVKSDNFAGFLVVGPLKWGGGKAGPLRKKNFL